MNSTNNTQTTSKPLAHWEQEHCDQRRAHWKSQFTSKQAAHKALGDRLKHSGGFRVVLQETKRKRTKTRYEAPYVIGTTRDGRETQFMVVITKTTRSGHSIIITFYPD